MKHKKLGEILLEQGKINIIQLGMALDIQKFKHLKIGQIFLEMRIINDNDLEYALKIQQNEIKNDF